MCCVVKNILMIAIILMNESAKATNPSLCLSNDNPNTDLMFQYLVAMNDSLSYLTTASSDVVFQSPMVAMNALYGLFLMKVNLKQVIHNNERKLSWDVRNYLNILIEKNAKVAMLYRPIIEVEFSSAKRIAPIIDNEDTWVKNIKKFSLDKGQLYSNYVYLFEERWPNTCMYILRVWKNIKENDIEFDDCYINIAEHRYGMSYECLMHLDCVRAAVAGGDFGYLLAHRIIMFSLAVYNGQCSITSYDEMAIRVLCQRAFAESVYIGNHWDEFADLLFEFIAICSLSGHSDFIQEVWFSKLLAMQEPTGKFAVDKSVEYKRCENRAGLVYEEPVHFDAVAVAALAAAARYTVESALCGH